MAKTNNRRGRKNNNPEGHNQYTNDWMDTVRDAPVKSAAAAAAAVGAGVFLWSRRNEISGKLSRLSDQISDWAEDMRSNMPSNSESGGESDSRSASASTRSRTGSSASTGGSRQGGRKSRDTGAMDEIGVIEVDTVRL
jgi:hypothetical protein